MQIRTQFKFAFFVSNLLPLNLELQEKTSNFGDGTLTKIKDQSSGKSIVMNHYD